jgi:hypothetical protein
MPYRSAGARRSAAHVATIPRSTVAPTITGTATAGQTLTVTNGTWAGNAATYTRQWLRDGATIGGATATTYVLQSADVGHVITCRVTATNSTGAVSATSNATASIAAAAPVNAGVGDQIVPSPTMDSSAGVISLANSDISGGAWNTGGDGDGRWTPTKVIVPGTYAISVTNAALSLNRIRVFVGGVSLNADFSLPGSTSHNVATGNIVVPAGTPTQELRVFDFSGFAWQITDFTVTRTA